MGLFYFESRIDGVIRGLAANSADNIDIARGMLEFTYGKGNVLNLEAIARGEAGQRRLNELMQATEAKQRAGVGVAADPAALADADRRRSGEYIPNPFVPNHNPATSTSPNHSMHVRQPQPAAAGSASAVAPEPAATEPAPADRQPQSEGGES